MMKYWKELNELENAVYQIKVIQSGLNLISESEQFTCYSPDGITQSFQTFVLDLNERMNEAVQKLDEQFNKVWDTVRDDTGRLGAAEEDADLPWEEEFTNEDIDAINDLVKDHESSIRFDKILSDLPTMNSSLDDSIVLTGAAAQSVYTVDGVMDNQFYFDFGNTENFEIKLDIDPIVSDR